VKEPPPADGPRTETAASTARGTLGSLGDASSDPRTRWRPAVSPRVGVVPKAEKGRPPPGAARPPVEEGEAAGPSGSAVQLAAELGAGLAGLRRRFRDVAAVVEGIGALRALRGEEALIEMALFAQSHEHTVDLAWEALTECEQLARRIVVSAAPLQTAGGSSLPVATEPAPAVVLAAQAELHDEPTTDAGEEEGPVTQVDVAPPRVLVVDDDPTVLRAFRRVLQPDHEVVTARDGAEALRMVLGGLRVDAIICDIGMPKLDGPAFFSELFELRPQMMPRVVFCTGGQPNERTQRFLDRMQAPLLYKPVAVADLRHAIEAVRSR
jgi:CheY-like chemotaxis protein